MVLKYWMRKKSQYTDEAGIPMLVSRYMKITVSPEKRDLWDT